MYLYIPFIDTSAPDRVSAGRSRAGKDDPRRRTGRGDLSCHRRTRGHCGAFGLRRRPPDGSAAPRRPLHGSRTRFRPGPCQERETLHPGAGPLWPRFNRGILDSDPAVRGQSHQSCCRTRGRRGLRERNHARSGPGRHRLFSARRPMADKRKTGPETSTNGRIFCTMRATTRWPTMR